MSADEDREETFAAKLRRLIDIVHPPDRGPYTYREIAAALEGQPGALTAGYLQQLATGTRTDPRMQYVQALAGFFGVPPAYFFDDAVTRDIEDQLHAVIAWRDSREGGYAQRMATLRPEDRHMVETLIDRLDRLDPTEAEHRRRRS